MQDPKMVVHRWFEEVWNQGRDETIDELLAADAVIGGLGEAESGLRGPAHFRPFYRNMRRALPNVKIRIEETVTEGARVVVRVVLEGTHMGDGLGVAATGREVRVDGMVMVRIADGKIQQSWNSWDQLGLLKQIGAPVEAEEDRFLRE